MQSHVVSSFLGVKMNLKNISRTCTLKQTEIDYYKEFGLFDEALDQNTELSDKQIETLCTISILRGAGLKKEQIAEYFIRPQNRMTILTSLRGELLETMHEKCKYIDKIDYLLRELQNRK